MWWPSTGRHLSQHGYDFLSIFPSHVSFMCVQACDPELTVLLYNKDGELVHLPLVSSGLAELE